MELKEPSAVQKLAVMEASAFAFQVIDSLNSHIAILPPKKGEFCCRTDMESKCRFTFIYVQGSGESPKTTAHPNLALRWFLFLKSEMLKTEIFYSIACDCLICSSVSESS